MKRISLLAIGIIISLISYAQDTIIGYSFSTNTTSSLYPSMGLAINNGFQFSYFSSETLVNDSVYFTNGASSGDYAATSTHWDNGSSVKYWLIKFLAPAYSAFTVSSIQRAGGTNNPGPKDFKIQWALNSGTFTDVINGAITVGNDWTTGVANNLSIPTSVLLPTDTINIRWIMTTNTNISGTNVTSNGVSKIDNILITGISNSGINNIINTPKYKIYPIPSEGLINIESNEQIKELSVFDIIGKQILFTDSKLLKYSIDLNSFGKGIYFVKIKLKDNTIHSSKAIIN